MDEKPAKFPLCGLCSKRQAAEAGFPLLIACAFNFDAHASEFAKMAEQAKAAGGIHHRFGIGDGFVVIVDEWESVDQFQQFFANPELQAFIGSVGAEPGPPELTIAESVTSPDQY